MLSPMIALFHLDQVLMSQSDLIACQIDSTVGWQRESRSDGSEVHAIEQAEGNPEVVYPDARFLNTESLPKPKGRGKWCSTCPFEP